MEIYAYITKRENYQTILQLQDRFHFVLNFLINSYGWENISDLIVTDDSTVNPSNTVLVLNKNLNSFDDLQYYVTEVEPVIEEVVEPNFFETVIQTTFTTPILQYEELDEDEHIIERADTSYSLPYRNYKDLVYHVLDKMTFSFKGGFKDPPFNWMTEKFSDWTHTTLQSGNNTVLTSKRSNSASVPHYTVLSSYEGIGGSTFALNLASILQESYRATAEVNKFTIYAERRYHSLFVDLDFQKASVSKLFHIDQIKEKNLYSLYCGYDLSDSSSKNLLRDLPEITEKFIPVIPVSPGYSLSEQNRQTVLRTDFSILKEALSTQCSSVVYDCGAIPNFKEDDHKGFLEFIKPIVDLRKTNFILLVDTSSNLAIQESIAYLKQLYEYISDESSYSYLSGIIIPVKGNPKNIYMLDNLLVSNGINNFKVIGRNLPWLGDFADNKILLPEVQQYIKREVI